MNMMSPFRHVHLSRVSSSCVIIWMSLSLVHVLLSQICMYCTLKTLTYTTATATNSHQSVSQKNVHNAPVLKKYLHFLSQLW